VRPEDAKQAYSDPLVHGRGTLTGLSTVPRLQERAEVVKTAQRLITNVSPTAASSAKNFDKKRADRGETEVRTPG
jgi:hypothetical protein